VHIYEGVQKEKQLKKKKGCIHSEGHYLSLFREKKARERTARQRDSRDRRSLPSAD